MSKTISRHNLVGVISIIIVLVTVISIFAYFSFYSNMNIGFIGNNVISNANGPLNHVIKNNDNIANLDENTSSTLIAVWIGLMIMGSYLLYYIHFKVLPKE